MTKKHRNWRVKARAEKKLPAQLRRRQIGYYLDIARKQYKNKPNTDDRKKAWIEKRSKGGIFDKKAYISKYPITIKEAFPDAKPYTDLKWPD